MALDLSKIKLIIWDLDESFWRGTLSEGAVSIPPENAALVRALTARGIIQTICSKNDPEPVMELLKKEQLNSYFVFPSINWLPKGPRIKRLIADMQLGEGNVLFIDDNPSNLEEARFNCPQLMTSEPSIISKLISACPTLGKDDAALTRLHQYQTLELKHHEAEAFDSNEAFLRQSDIRVQIDTDCIKEADRLYELVIRTNQLNFTKARPTRNDFDALLRDDNIEKGYVSVSDRYGDYGIAGFYAVENGKALHFLFSCRILNMGVEQYAYAYLHYPSLTPVPPLSGSVSKDQPMPAWINCETPPDNDAQENIGSELNRKISIFIKGPCDLSRSLSYLKIRDSDVELGYTDANGRFYNYQNHLVNILASVTCAPDENCAHLRGMPFESPDWFRTDFTKKKYDLVFLSLLPVANTKVYRHKASAFRVALGSRAWPMSDPGNWPLYTAQGQQSQMFTITEESLRRFCDQFEPVDDYVETEMADDIRKLLAALPKHAKMCMILTNEHAYAGPSADQEFKKKLNDVVRRLSADEPRVSYIDINEFVLSAADTTNSDSHFTSKVYFEISQRLAKEIIAVGGGTQLRKTTPVIRETGDKLKAFIAKAIRSLLGHLKKASP